MSAPDQTQSARATPLERLRRSRSVALQLEAHAQHREYERLTDRIAADAPGEVLDWGCGLGQVSDLLRAKGVRTTSYEYRPELTETTEQRLDRFPEIVARMSPDPVALPYPDGSFDAALSCGVLEHVSHPEESLDELRRVLKPGGTLYVYKLPNRFSWLEWVARRLGMMHHGSQPYDRLYGKRDAIELLERHGYAVRECRRANMLPLTVRARAIQRFTEPYWKLNRGLAMVPGLNVLATNVELVATAPGPSGDSGAADFARH